ncbi:MAG: sulfate adenylyltransferase subunit 2 [Candidatus Aenigmarchaeota archaeon]|nr:sulfate adenylyltransferase subunit 2 [Candidatus Aenigmarchaeota archaeon]
MDHLDELESKSIYIIREAYHRFKNIAALWSVGKDSTVMLHLIRKSFFGRIPFPVIYIDTGKHFKEMYEFRDKIAKEWNLNLIISRNKEADDLGIGPEDKFKCCNMRKTEALKKTIKEYGFDALILGIRRDEHGVRAKERYISPRDEKFQWNYEDQPPEIWDQYKTKTDEKTHMRVHPLLHWTELDVWLYIKREKLPVNPLYFARKVNGVWKRYRSLGCEPCTTPIESTVKNIDEMIEEIKTSKTAERAGRSLDKEKIMQRLRALGYM